MECGVGEGCSFVFENNSVDVGMMSLLPVISHSRDKLTSAFAQIVPLPPSNPPPLPSHLMFSLPVSLHLYLCLLPQRSLVAPGDAAQPVCVSCLEVQQQSWGAQVPASVRASACRRARPELRTCACTFSEMGY